MSEMFNRNAIGVRAHADGVGVKRSNVSSEAVQGINARSEGGKFADSYPEPCKTSALARSQFGFANLLRSQRFR